MPMSAEARFLAKVRQVDSGCHEWQSTIHRDGYGKFWFEGQPSKAHRVAWRLFRGEIPPNQWVLHRCDNRKCVNPEHLYLGTPSDNARDKVERFQGLWGRMKFGPDACAEVHRLRAQGLSQQAVASALGMDQTTVSRIDRRASLISQRELT